MHLIVTTNEICGHVLVRYFIAGMEDRAGVGAENRVKSLLVIRLYRIVESQGSISRVGKRLFSTLLRNCAR